MEFIYGDKVEVIAGFYKGCMGIVEDYSKTPTETIFYNVTITMVIDDCWKRKVCEIRESYLQKPIL
jgi:ribosomal protein L24